MSTISRRKFLGNAGLLGAGAVMAEGAFRSARADKPHQLLGLGLQARHREGLRQVLQQEVRRPGEVRGDPVGAVPPDHGDARLRRRDRGRHVLQSQQPRALVRERADPPRRRPARHGRAEEEDDPGEPRQPEEPATAASSSACPTSPASSSSSTTSRCSSRPGIKAPAKSWDELVEHCTKLKRDKVSDTPFLPNWNNSPSGTMPQFMTDCFSEGANVFDAKNQVIVDQEPGVARAMERWQKVYKAGPGEPGGAHQDLVHRHPPALLDRALRLPHQPLLLPEDHRRGARELEARAQEGEDGDVPGHRPDLHVDRLLHRERQDQGPRGRLEAHHASWAATATATGTCSASGA